MEMEIDGKNDQFLWVEKPPNSSSPTVVPFFFFFSMTTVESAFDACADLPFDIKQYLAGY
jgi:hypothetical protein